MSFWLDAGHIINSSGYQHLGCCCALSGLTKPSLAIIPALQAAGAMIRAHDPEGMAEASKLLSAVEWCDGPYHAAERADVLVIITEWDAYRALDLSRLKRLMRGATFVDLRNVYKPEEVTTKGFAYCGVGLGTLVGSAQEGSIPADGGFSDRESRPRQTA